MTRFSLFLSLWIGASEGERRGERRGERVQAQGCRASSHDGTRQLPSAVTMSHRSSPARAYDFLLKFLLVGDSDVGKGEILASLQDGATESPYGHNMGE